MKCVYILRSLTRPSQIYVGVSSDLEQRLDYHNSGRCLHSSKFKPWNIVYVEMFDNPVDAHVRERQLKKWSRSKKEALIAGDKIKLKELSQRKN